MNQILQPAFHDLHLIRQHNPVIHNLTNFVVMSTTANLLLAIGASPVMAHAEPELQDIVTIANAVVINIGTLDPTWIQAIEIAQQIALSQNKPIIFDPVGAGASRYRTDTALHILKTGVDIVRANSAEILALDNRSPLQSKGVDSLLQSEEAIDAAKQISEKYQCTVVISGKNDIIVHSDRVAINSYGTSLFTKVTGMGCSATAIIGAFAAINKNYFDAAQHAMQIYTIAGEMAAKSARGPLSFYQTLVDTLFHLQETEISQIGY